ncbi:MAG TPA: hydrogenase subunit MbhD domain-containing protein [Dissulfurispiraceae bacterium]
MTALHFIIYLLLAVVGAGVVFTRDPLPQAIVAGIYGMLLSLLFIALQAPDVALSEIAIGAVMFPLMVLLALTKIRGKGSE